MTIILLLVIIDLSIKTIMYFNFINTHIKFLGGYLGIAPTINRDQISEFETQFNIGINTPTLIILNVFILTILFYIYYRFIKTGYMNLHIRVIIAMFISGSICSLIDKIVLRGSINYFYVNTWAFDLKDIYLYTSLLYLIFYLLKPTNFTAKVQIKKLPNE
ncbi:signal peptidase II [Pseudobacteroides cellulosolvens]|uniref:Peptidase A8 signal peptidase II n=1 Tax=Pseudobacteroides cellulosolvens ATCC 35603 = DSM 2933 TaxID=398512 RepID=A0A0L6JVC2_9FIRM|nr:signal peptidase II [Pseudobacteroides cellulosolvens]KNY29377.1 peptidase A8 signal peptidase II [Pseudobacteroides cellulosolvens ATCC 35603 = DSM 2933]